MKTYNYMCFSTSFYREVEDRNVHFMLTVDNVGRVQLRAIDVDTSSILNDFKYTFEDGELQIKL